MTKITNQLVLKTRIIVVIMSIAPVLLAFVAMVIHFTTEAVTSDVLPIHLLVLSVIAVLGGLISFFWGPSFADRIITTVPDKPLMSWFIILAAACEGPAILGGTTLLLAAIEGSISSNPWIWFTLFPIILMVQASISNFPDKQRMEEVYVRLNQPNH